VLRNGYCGNTLALSSCCRAGLSSHRVSSSDHTRVVGATATIAAHARFLQSVLRRKYTRIGSPQALPPHAFTWRPL